MLGALDDGLASEASVTVSSAKSEPPAERPKIKDEIVAWLMNVGVLTVLGESFQVWVHVAAVDSAERLQKRYRVG